MNVVIMLSESTKVHNKWHNGLLAGPSPLLALTRLSSLIDSTKTVQAHATHAVPFTSSHHAIWTSFHIIWWCIFFGPNNYGHISLPFFCMQVQHSEMGKEPLSHPIHTGQKIMVSDLMVDDMKVNN